MPVAGSGINLCRRFDRAAGYRSFGPKSTSNVGVPEVLDQLCRILYIV